MLTPVLSSAPDVATYKLATEPKAELSTYRLVAATSPSYSSSSSGSGSRESSNGPLMRPNDVVTNPVAGSIASTPALDNFVST